MKSRHTIVAIVFLSIFASHDAVAQQRAIRRDIPITNMIRRAYGAGTRDSTGRPGPKYWLTSVEYKIDAKLDAPASTVTGRETIVLHNNSPDTLKSISFRLDQNIFSANVPRMSTVPEVTEGMRVTRIAIDGVNVDVNTPAARGQGFMNPGAPPPSVPMAYNLNLTLARIALAKPIAPKSSATIDVDWNFRVPLVPFGRGLRMGRMGDSIYQVAQWYPRVAVYDDYRGWDSDPYLGNAEFYNNFGRFEVNYDVPAGWLVGSSGVLQNPEQVFTPEARARMAHALEADTVVHVVTADDRANGKSTAAGDRLIWRFVADSVADVAWATSKSYILDVTRATIPGKGAIPVHLFYVPNVAADYANAATSARHALEFYSGLWMPYAFPQLTLSYGVELGMEYPMFIMSGYGAADHETGHEWWPMMVGVNETWWGFMDEGFNQYMNVLSANDRFACTPAKTAGTCRTPLQGVNGAGQSYGRQSGSELEPSLMWDENYAGPMYSFAAYGKAPMMLSMLGGVAGDSAVWRAQSDYAKAWRFKHPTPWDYAFFMSNALKQDLGWFWYYWLFTTESVEGSIQNVVTSGKRTTVTVRQNGQMPSPVVLKVEFAAKGPAIKLMPNSTMADSASVIVKYPVDVWFDGKRTFNAVLDFGGRIIEKITLDPFGRFPDKDLTDNVWPRVAATSTQ